MCRSDMWVELNEAERRLAEYLARCRMEWNRKVGSKDMRRADCPLQTDLEGIGAELAFCKIFNIWPDMNTEAHPSEDAVLNTGHRVDVKSTRVENGHLLVMPTKDKLGVDLYALVIGTFPRYRFAGFAKSEDVFQDDKYRHFGRGMNYVLTQAELFTDLG